jgi:hypothetical protein
MTIDVWMAWTKYSWKRILLSWSWSSREFWRNFLDLKLVWHCRVQEAFILGTTHVQII